MLKTIEDINLLELIINETGNTPNRAGYICCPFHKEKTGSLKVKFDSNSNKDKFKCFGCGEAGDAIDFIMKIRGIGYNEAREYLGLEVKKSFNELETDKIREYIDWQINHRDDYIGFKLIGLFQFVDKNNKPLYYKAKFLKPDGSKITPYYHIEENKVINTRKYDEVPYNLYNILRAIEEGKIIIIVEGEKDANTLNKELKNSKYVATSLKGVKDLSFLKIEGVKIFVIGDTGEAGQKYIEKIKYELLETAGEFRVIKLKNITSLGDNKDVTDWLNAGHTKYELTDAFRRSLDLKSKTELQQDWKGVYKLYYDKKTEEYRKIYITNFQILDAKRLKFIEDEKEGIKLILKSFTGNTIEKAGFSTVFDDLKSFRNFLGTLDLAFTSKNIEDLITFKVWVNNFFAIDNESRYNGVQWIKENDKLFLVTGDGAIGSNKNDYSLLSDMSKINLIDKEKITTDELRELKGKLFKFWEPSKSVSIIGTIINDLAAYHNEEAGEKLHILLIVGESESGKSTILEKVIAPILNYPLEDKKSMATSAFAIIKDASTGNYPTIYDEFKPSMMDKYKVSKLSDIFRNIYDRQAINKGDKSFKIRSFRLARPLIMAGEENYPNSETAALTRSCIVYLSKRERTEKNAEAMKWLVENKSILNKFGRSLINTILNMTIEEYKEIRKAKKECFKGFKERVLDTAINISCGIEIYNKLLQEHGLTKISNYEEFIYENLKEEILENGEDAKSTVERMLMLYDDMIENGRAYEPKDIIQDRGDGLFIRTSEMINQIHMFVNQVGSAEVIPLKLRDFKKQAKKSGYLINNSCKVIKINGKTVRFDEYSKSRMRELGVDSIVSRDITLDEMSEKEQKVIQGYFN